MSVSDRARLALDILDGASRLRLAAEDPRWIALLNAILASVPSDFEKTEIELLQVEGQPLDGGVPGRMILGFSPTVTSDEDQLFANVWVSPAIPPTPTLPGHPTCYVPPTPTLPGHPTCYVSTISLTASFAAAGDGDPPSFDVFQEAAGSDHFHELRVFVREGNALDAQGMRAVLRSLLRREQLTWALERDILRLQHCVCTSSEYWHETAYMDRRNILSALADGSLPTIDDTPAALEDDEYAEYLSLFFEDKKIDYLRQLPALRVEREKAKALSSEETSGLPADQDTVTATPA
ncbi:hypothetical protein PsYK624_121960 [Phanerochaete sordida]|uniref:Uncharacterized protein n=1 Tax=Phanerochaete sordida TaxID=48140 RepID=A0A9P3GHD2_9APHY|nr:hypothetical protein PsYK624_121960 [Phanerochaete sordida]